METDLIKKITDLPQSPGVYFFKDSSECVLYVGKAKNLKKRVKNHFQKPEQHSFDFISRITDIDFIQTATENEALILEQQFIKKIQPRWNTEWKDDKNYFFVGITGDKFPRVYLTHQPSLAGARLLRTRRSLAPAVSDYFGPFVSGREIKSFLREIRKVVPYRTCANLPKKPCMYAALGLCTAPCIYPRRKKTYDMIVQTLEVLLRIYGGKTGACRELTSREENRHSQSKNTTIRVEGYDISNLSGTLAVGSMVVFENGKPNKNEYRKFKIKNITGQNDVGSLREVITRRLKHDEWHKPDIMLIDGGKGQLKAIKGLDVPAIALAKFKHSGGKIFTPYSKNSLKLDYLPENVKNLLLQVRDEAHRFAISYHRSRRLKIIKKIPA